MQKGLPGAKKYLKRRRRHRMWKRVVSVLACIVVFVTTYALILPAIALEQEKTVYCGYEEHEHTDACYGDVLICSYGEEESEKAEAGTESEDATESETNPESVTEPETETESETNPESGMNPEGGTETGGGSESGMNPEDGTESESKEESGDAAESVTNPKSAAETGAEQDGADSGEKNTAITGEDGNEQNTAAGQESAGSFFTEETIKRAITAESDENEENVSGGEEETGEKNTAEKDGAAQNDGAEHVHTTECYELICGKEAHVHTLICYSDRKAGVETEDDWKETLPLDGLSGAWADDLLMIAESQSDYEQVSQNYDVIETEDGGEISGYYTRYGEWYGEPYGNWNAMFAAFCLYYAQVPEEAMPRSADIPEWIGLLSDEAYELYFEAQDYEPRAGDLAFFDTDGDGEADRVGIVAEYRPKSLLTGAKIKTIEGDLEGKVASAAYALDDESIVGYAWMPENPEAGIATMAADGSYARVNNFYLWLHLQDQELYGSSTRMVYGNSEWSAEAGAIDGKTGGIKDALTYTEEGETYYLIPISYFIQYYKDYGYTFDGEGTKDGDVSPFVYMPNAGNKPSDENANLTEAVYVYIGNGQAEDGDGTEGSAGDDSSQTESDGDGQDANAGWYVRVLVEGDYDPPRSNIYYTYYGTQEVGKFRLWMWARESGADGYTQAAGYGQNAEISDVLRICDVKNQATDYYLIPIRYFNDAYERYGFRFDEENADTCPILYDPDASVGGDEFKNAGYIYMEGTEEVQGGWYVRVEDTGSYPYSEPDIPRSNVYFRAAKAVTDTVSPSGTVINLFDYWATDVSENDVTKNYFDLGINKDHPFKFKATGLSEANTWTESEMVYQGIVNPVLTGGYPVLTNEEIFGQSDGSVIGGGESLKYLFDPTYTGASAEYRSAYRNVSGLLQVDTNGYYYYDSKKNYAEFDSDSNRFILYDDWAVTYTPHAGETSNVTNNGQFFPFDAFDTVTHTTNAGIDSLNHFFGMTLTARFIQQYDGHTDARKNTDMIFDFSGDDDVWIFIDDVLVADLGGIHDIASVDINFATGAVTINEKSEKEECKKVSTIKRAFIDAGKATADDTEGWNGDTFANDTYHTLKFFYLERGSYASNLYLKYNLNVYPPTSIYKVNQYGETVKGATFAVYAADGNYNILSDKGGDVVNLDAYTYGYDDGGNIIIDGSKEVLAKALYKGTTDQNGEMIFVDEDNVPYTLTDLENMFGDHFVLKEIEVPQGYRLVSDVIKLYIYNHKALMCEDTFSSGVFADASVLITAPSQLLRVNKEDIPYVNEKGETVGTLFAVVLKYIGPTETKEDGTVAATAAGLKLESSWAPVYGTAASGFNVVKVDEQGGFVNAVIDAAKKYVESNNVFEISASGQAQAQINGLPGNIMNYYYMLKDGEKEKTEYTIAYYYSTADKFENVDADNTSRIDADAEGYAFTRSFGAEIKVPNLINRLFAQKLDESGTLVNGAGFALYKVVQADTENAPVYYVSDKGINIYLEADADGDNKGIARLHAEEEPVGVYTINAGTGVIEVKIDGSDNTGSNVSDTITPVAVQTTLFADDENNPAKEDGTASFTNMDDGYYYLREISAPEGYMLNTTEVMVLVDETAVYANAGTATDGVTVGRGPGYVCKTLSQFASKGQIDNTLSWVYEQLLVSKVSSSFRDVYGALEGTGWNYLKSYTGKGFDAVTELTDISYGNKTDTGDSNDEESTGDAGDSSGGEATENTGDVPLTAHLEYSSDGVGALFNYTINRKWYTDNGQDPENVTRRLYTSVGWSYYLLYQDYEYGKGQYADGANYTKLATAQAEGVEEPMEISNLFSRSTFVQVTDRINELIIRKADGATLTEVKNKEGNITGYNYETLKGAEFTLARTIKKSDGSEEMKYYQVETKETDDGNGNTATVITTDWVAVEPDGEIPDFGTDENGAITIKKLVDGVYTLTEVKAPDGYQLPENSFTFTVSGGRIAATSGNKVIATKEPVKTAETEGSEAIEDEDSIIVLIILNNRGYMLPNTGGSGTDLFTIGGVVLMTAAVGIGYRLRRRRERREKVRPLF